MIATAYAFETRKDVLWCVNNTKTLMSFSLVGMCKKRKLNIDNRLMIQQHIVVEVFDILQSTFKTAEILFHDNRIHII